MTVQCFHLKLGVGISWKRSWNRGKHRGKETLGRLMAAEYRLGNFQKVCCCGVDILLITTGNKIFSRDLLGHFLKIVGKSWKFALTILLSTIYPSATPRLE